MAEPTKKEPQPAEPPKETVAEQPVNEVPKENVSVAEAPVSEAPVAEASMPEVKEEKLEETPVAEEIVYEDETDDDNNLGDLNDVEDDDNGEEERADDQDIPITSAAPDVVVDEYTQHWNTMLDIVFANHPSVQSPLRDMPPKIVDNVMKIKVSGSIQQKTLEQKKRDMLEYFRNNYREDIDDIEVEVDAKVETKKVIYGNEDKLNYQRQQNRDMDDFLKKLNLKLV